MQRTVNDMSSHHNMLAPEEEIIVERTGHEQEELLKKENQELKVTLELCGKTTGGRGYFSKFCLV